MRKTTIKSRLLSWLLCAALLLGMLPTAALAAGTGRADPATGIYEAPATVSVEYPTTDRSTAQIIYRKEGIAATPYNLIFLVDASVTGADSALSFQRMMLDVGASYIYDYGAASSTRIIYYQNSVMQNSSSNSKSVTSMLNPTGFVIGQGVARESVALQAAVQAVQGITNDDPTVVFWVAGSKLTESPDVIEPQLQALTAALDPEDALVTWQLADTPSELLTRYATEHTQAHKEGTIRAAHADSSAVLFRSGMAEMLEQLVHDHYHDIRFSLALDGSQTLVKQITDVRYESSSTAVSLSATLGADKKSVDVHLGQLCRSADISFVLTVELDTSVYAQQTVIAATSINAPADHSNGGMHTGLFDQNLIYGLLLHLPPVQLDRRQFTIAFDAGGTGTAPSSIQKITDEFVVIPNGDDLSSTGSSFGGWNVDSGVNLSTHYNVGEVIRMPEGNMTLKPAWGHVEVELELNNLTPAPPAGNNMHANASTLLDFSSAQVNGRAVGLESVKTISFIDADPVYSLISDHNDPNRVSLSGVPNAVYARHVGAQSTDHVVAYLVPRTDPNTYDMYVSGPGGVKAAAATSKLFRGSASNVGGVSSPYMYVESMDLSQLDTSAVVNMSEWFKRCENLKSLKLGDRFSTASVRDMSNMFYKCTNLSTLDVSGWDTSKVTNMYTVFYGCKSLTTLDVSGWNTSQVTTMVGLFNGCTGLRALDVSRWNTSKVDDMHFMFGNCASLSELDLQSFDTAKVTDMSSMFSGCSGLTTLNVSSFDTAQVTNMRLMFNGCEKLTTLDLSSFVPSKVTTMESMFYNCSGLTTLDLSSFDTSQVTNMSAMFNGCSGLTTLDLSRFDTSQVTNMSAMFNGCSGLTTLDLSRFDTSQVTNMSSMFSGCKKLTTLNVSSFDTSQVTNMSAMFNGCSGLTDLNISNFDTSKVTRMNSMFYGCTALRTLNLGNQFDISQSTRLDYAFSNCKALETINGKLKLGENNAATQMTRMFLYCEKLTQTPFELPATGQARFDSLSTMQYMFDNCRALQQANLGGWVLPNLTDTRHMFLWCTALQQIDLSWSGLRATADQFNATEMFGSYPGAVPSAATLNTGSDTSSQAIMTKIAALFPGTASGVGAAAPTSLFSAPAAPPAEQNAPTVEAAPAVDDVPTATPSPDEDVPAVPPSPAEDAPEAEDVPTIPPFPAEDTPETEDMPAVPPSSAEDVPAVPQPPVSDDTASSDASADTIALPTLSLLMNSGSADAGISVHDTETPPNSTFTYRIRVKYVGDTGVQSGAIQLYYPLPEQIKPVNASGNAITDPAQADQTTISVSAAEYTDGTVTGYLGGHVVTAPYLSIEGSQFVLRGTLAGLYTGNQIEITLKCVNQSVGAYNPDGYMYWDSIAYAQDVAASASSNVLRLWHKQTGTPTPPTAADQYMLRYQYEGDVPPDVSVPQGGIYAENAPVTSANTPVSVYPYYTFDGWYRSDNDTKVTPGSGLTMPTASLRLIGKWSINETLIPKVTVQYRYDTSGSQLPAGVPTISNAVVPVGDTHYIVRILQDVDFHFFGGWTPTLSVGQTNIPLTSADGGRTYTGGGYTIDIAGGVLQTEQFRNAADVVVTLTGVWKPYTGTIQFEPNGGQGRMTSMTDVAYNTTSTLPPNQFTYTDPYGNRSFRGWAISPAGAVVKSNGAVADGLILTRGAVVPLYAVWTADAYDVHLELTNTTAEHTRQTVNGGGSYTNQLSAAPGYVLQYVTVRMNNVDMTDNVYDAATGRINIPGVNGDIIITAVAVPTVTFDAGGGSVTPRSATVGVDGKLTSLPIPARDGYTFDGWFTAASGGTKVTLDTVFTKSTTIYAQWTAGGSSNITYYTLTFHTNGGSGVDPIRGTAGTQITLRQETRREGYRFTGWYLDQALTEKTTVVTLTRNITVYAGWQANTADPNTTGVSAWLNTSDHLQYLNGYSADQFAPNRNMTRAEAAQMFYNLLLKQDVSLTTQFSDVADDAWYAKAVNTLASQGIITGYGNGNFGPHDKITRAQFITIAMRFAKQETGGENIFSDVSESAWYYSHVIRAIQYGWINGYADGTFRPDATVTRAEVTAITNRLLGRSADITYINQHRDSLRQFSDLSISHWAYYDIMEATNAHNHSRQNGAEHWLALK